LNESLVGFVAFSDVRCGSRNRSLGQGGNFKSFVEDVSLMGRTQPNYSAHDLAKISAPIVIVQSEHDEFIKREHAEYLARSIPNAEFALLNGVSHFAPLQRPRQFNAAILEFVSKVLPTEGGNGICSTT
jgi:pimeloyl-ACP methyl ester carboxylesterase